MIQQRDILLVSFPFSDQSGKKVRPVVVLSNDVFNGHSDDLLVAFVTSVIKGDAYSVALSTADIEEGILHDACCIKAESILKLDKKLVIKKIGRVKKGRFSEILRVIWQILS